jgi:molybdenum cofactor cytidylyltransferase
MAEITGVLLAAGFSSRFDAGKSPGKLQYEIDGRPLIAHSAAALAPCDHIVAVVRTDDAALQTVLRALGVDCVLNPDPARGIGYSIACAVKATPPSQHGGWCLLPADMPYVKATTTQRLVGALRGGAELAAPFYRERRGHPVAFGARFRHALAALDGDTGARVILQQFADRLIAITSDDAGVLADIDVVTDLRNNAHRNRKFDG